MKSFKFRRAVTSVVTALMVMASFAVPLPALAQTANTGVITGVVKDSNGAVVPGATVKAINKATGVERKTNTSDSGVYELTQMVPADYRVEVEAKGFARLAAEPVTVNVLQRTTLDLDLKPAGTSEQVTVTAEGAALVETGKTDVGGVINQKQLESLPVNGRSFASLAVLIPGATLEPSFDPTKARTGTFSIGGSTGRNLNITVDGGDNKDNAVGGILQNFTMEGIQEFALSTQRFSAANGRSGGALLSVVTKSGSNRLSGSAFGFFRDDKFNANAPQLLADANAGLFPDPADIIKPPFQRQQFGGSIGGPIIKDKLFWFGAVEHSRERGNSIVPGSIFNQIVLLEPLGYKAVRFLPQPYDDTQFQLKGDYHPSSDHSFTLRYAQQNNKSINDQAGFLTVFTDLSGGDKQLNDLHSLLGSWTWTASPHVVNQFTYQWSTFNNQILATTDLNNLVFSDGLAVGRNGNVPQQTLQRKHQFRDDLTWSHGNHGLKFGADFVYEPVLGGIFAFNSAPEFDFVDTAQNIATDKATYPKGFFTPGSVGDIALSGGDPSFDLVNGAKQFAAYVQDDWKIRPRLTLNLGVRYDVDIGFVDSKHQEQGNRVLKALKIIGNPLGSRVVKDDKNNFSPRLGFAWDIKGNGRSVVRGGYGIYYDQSFLNVPLFAVQQANTEIYATFFNDADGLSLASAPPPIPRPLTNPAIGLPVRGRLIDPSFESPFSQQFNVGFAKEIGTNMALEFDYIHILGLHEFTQIDANPRIGPLQNAQRTSASPPRLLTPQFNAHSAEMIAAFGQTNPFTGIRVAQSDGRSRYDAFTVSFRRRYSNHFQLNAHYTLSRGLAWFGQISDFGVQPQNPFNKFDAAENFGHTGEDERHRFVVSGVFDLKWGFQLSPIVQLASARPYSIFPDPSTGAGGDINRDGVLNDRESRDGNDQHHLPPFTERGDKFSQVNLRVAKNFKFREHMNLGLFFEAFNMFNTANFGNSFDGTKGSPNFKKPINFFGATGFSEPIGIPFQGQFGFRFSF
ncbi:MAG TPA: TonB-dependent receptor [Blastocatellia bacterium]|nr:TonB-dependent receptor [Blastocatellia bacterium]